MVPLDAASANRCDSTGVPDPDRLLEVVAQPFRHVSTHVQDVWEVLDGDGHPYSFVELTEASTPAQALAVMRERVAASEAQRQRLIERYGELEESLPEAPTLSAVRRRTSVSTDLYTTDYGEELAVADLEAQANA